MLKADAWRTLLASGVAAVLFLVLSWALRREARRREAIIAQQHRERRLAALGRMSAVLAHELRNPLASLKGHAQLLREMLNTKPLSAAQAQRKAGRVVDEAQRLQDLTLDLLAFVRSGELRFEKVDFCALVEQAVEQGGGATLQLPTEAVEALADPGRLGQAIRNLVENAHEVSDELPLVTLLASDREIQIDVHDRGPGVSSADRKLVFEPFHTTRAQGTGLGLAITNSIAQAHNGSVEVKDRDGGGASFSLRIPRKAEH